MSKPFKFTEQEIAALPNLLETCMWVEKIIRDQDGKYVGRDPQEGLAELEEIRQDLQAALKPFWPAIKRGFRLMPQ